MCVLLYLLDRLDMFGERVGRFRADESSDRRSQMKVVYGSCAYAGLIQVTEYLWSAVLPSWAV